MRGEHPHVEREKFDWKRDLLQKFAECFKPSSNALLQCGSGPFVLSFEFLHILDRRQIILEYHMILEYHIILEYHYYSRIVYYSRINKLGGFICPGSHPL